MHKLTDTLHEKPGLTDQESAILEKILKGELSYEGKLENIPKREIHSPVPLSFSQQRLWVLDRLMPGNPNYNVPGAYRFIEKIDIPVFERVVNEIIRRHESLRTIFATEPESDKPVQIILPKVKIKVDIVDLRELPAPEQEEQIVRFTTEEAGKSFDLEKGPLLRVTLLHLSDVEHILLFTTHHIICDGWSMGVFIRELAIIYSAFSIGKPSPLPELPLQYADFAVWQRNWLTGEILEKQLSYWRKVLSGELPTLELPTDRPRPAVPTYQGDSQIFEFPGNLPLKLFEFNQREECSMFMTLMAAFNVLLYRYSGQDDILVGYPIANRNRPQLEQMIGFFVNTLVIRTDLTGHPSFRQLLARVRTVASEAYDNQDLPFEKLVEEFQPNRYINQTPLFQVMFNCGGTSGKEKTASGSNIRELPVHNKTSKFDLWLSLHPSKEKMWGAIEYNTDIFENATITRLIGHFKTLLAAISADPDQSINDLPLLTGDEAQILTQWNNTGKTYDTRCLHHSFENQAIRTPQAVALVFENQSMTYAELNRRASELACHLKNLGMKPDGVVGVCMERSIEMVIALLGILKAEGAYLPLDPEYPKERLNYVISDSKILILLTQARILDRLPRGDLEILCMDRDLPSINRSYKDIPGGDVSLGNAAYVIYTSGSTGNPKGVIISHEGINNRLQWMQDRYRLTREDRVLQKTPFSFDVSVWEFFWPLLNGAVLVIARPGGHKDCAYLIDMVKREKITTIHFVPSMLNVFIDDLAPSRLPSLKRVISSGEALPMEYQERFFSQLDAELHNLYGPTEASVDVTSWTCTPNSDWRSVPIGHPIANTRIYILDRDLKPVPIGVHGEIHIRGIQLARGYLNQPELTAEKFVRVVISHSSLVISKSLKTINNSSKLSTNDQWPIANDRSHKFSSNDRLYKTGDTARWLPDGSIEFIGRLDFQVKIRGFRIEPGEIESHLRNHPSLDDAVVLDTEHTPDSNEKKLIAYIVPANDFLELYEKKSAGELVKEKVREWQGIFDDAYEWEIPLFQSPGSSYFNIAGWISSYTGKPIDADEMREWVAHTVERILSLKPVNVLEIGCGTGLFLFSIIPFCKQYVGTDISETCLNYIRRHLDKVKDGATEVKLFNKTADDFQGIEADSFDLVILNSVTQYFPSADYLVKVLTNAVKAVKPGGYIFLGDIRSLPLVKTFYASVEFYQADAGDSKKQLYSRVMNRKFTEKELVIDPEFFIALKEHLPKIKHVELLLKYGHYYNELSKFRFDVIFHIGNETGNFSVTRSNFIDWKREQLTPAEVHRVLIENEPEIITITGIPNGRIAVDVQLLKWITGKAEPETTAEFREIMTTWKDDAVDPEEFRKISKKIPYDIVITLSDAGPDFYDVTFKHRKLLGNVFKPVKHLEKGSPRWSAYTNNPLLAKVFIELVPELRSYLKEKLSEYMIPSYFIPLEKLPLTPHGKLDLNALTRYGHPSLTTVRENQFVEPRTHTEKLFVDTWQDVLLIDKIGINDNFFQLGGDSVNAIQVISRINKKGFNLSIRNLYQNLTIAELARFAGKLPGGAGRKEDVDHPAVTLDKEKILGLIPPGVEIEDIYPLTSYQKHMLLYYLDPTQENEPGIFITQRTMVLPANNLDISTIREAFKKAVETYPYFRTAFMWEGLEEPVQVVYKNVNSDISFIDWSYLAPDELYKRFKKFAEDDHCKGFERDKPEVSRMSLIKTADYLLLVNSMDYMKVDGWSTAIVLNTLMSYIIALSSGKTIEMKINHNYKHYLAWEQKQNQSEGEIFWREMLSEHKGAFPTPLVQRTPGNTPGQEKGFTTEHVVLSEAETTKINLFLKQNQLVLSTIVNACWALILSYYTSEKSVIFGVLLSGRSISLPFIEEVVGVTLSVLPMKVTLVYEKPISIWLREIWNTQVELSQYESTPQEKIREWWGTPQDKFLFESYIVVQNFPQPAKIANANNNNSDKSSKPLASMFSRYIAHLEYPLRVELLPEQELVLLFQYHLRCFNRAVMKKMLDDFRVLLLKIIENLEQTIGDLVCTIEIPEGK